MGLQINYITISPKGIVLFGSAFGKIHDHRLFARPEQDNIFQTDSTPWNRMKIQRTTETLTWHCGK